MAVRQEKRDGENNRGMDRERKGDKDGGRERNTDSDR